VTFIFVVPGEPMGKPRMTRADKWKTRECVMRYRGYADLVRLKAPAELHTFFGVTGGAPYYLAMTAFFSLPTSYSKKKQDRLAGKLHQVKPDIDNVTKTVMDALFKNDSSVARIFVEKKWDDGKGARVEICVAGEIP
jgi:Holliday junction resolvase RusA-like endonuclease